MTRRRILQGASGLVVLAVVLLVTFAFGVGAGTAVPSPPASTGAAKTGRALVVVGAGGLSWSDVSPSATPHLWRMLRGGGSAAVSVRSIHANTCPVDGWLSLSAGTRAGGPGDSPDAKPPCAALPTPAREAGRRVTVPGWDRWVALANGRRSDAHPGLLGDALASHHRCVQAIGPGAAVAAATSQGVVARYAPYRDSGRLPLADCPVSIVDVGAVRAPGDVDPADAVQPRLSRAAQVHRADRRIGRVMAEAPADADLLVAALTDAGRSEHLRLVALEGPGVAPGTLYSTSTRQLGLVQSADVTATVLDHVGMAVPEAVSGSPLLLRVDAAAVPTSPDAVAARLQLVRDLGRAAQAVQPLVGPFFGGWVLLQAVAYALGWWRWRRAAALPPAECRRARAGVAGWVAFVATAAAGIPVSTFLANALPWWRSSLPLLAVVGAVLLFDAVLLAVSYATWGRARLGPLGVVCGFTVVALAVDMTTGSRLQLSSLLGLQPVVGGRFYGMGNVTFALFATAALLVAVFLAGPLLTGGRRRLATVVVLVVGLGAVLIDVAPRWGSDFGGTPALLPAVGYLALATLGLRLTWARTLAIAFSTVALLTLISVLDWLRPPEARSHLGRFVQSIIDGGASDIIVRKLDQNIGITLSTPLTMLVPLGLLYILYILARPASRPGRLLQPLLDRVPLLRPGLVALAVCLVIGFALNDSGSAIPAVSGLLFLPVLLAAALRTRPHAAVAPTPEPAVRRRSARR